MTRRRVVFVDCGEKSNVHYYITPEFNGDKSEFERIGSTDSCDKTWEEIKEEFLSDPQLSGFFRMNEQAQKYYHSSFGHIKPEPVKMISPLELSIYENSENELLFIHKGQTTAISNFARTMTIYDIWCRMADDGKKSKAEMVASAAALVDRLLTGVDTVYKATTKSIIELQENVIADYFAGDGADAAEQAYENAREELYGK